MILALDIGTKLGYYREGDKGAYTIPLGKGDERFYQFRKNLMELIIISDTTVIAYEKAAFQQGHAIPIYHGMVGILKSTAMFSGISYVSIPVGTIKKCFTGKGRWDKKDCNIFNHDYELKLPKAKINKAPMMAVCIDLGISYDDDNAVDAYATYYTYKKLYEGEKHE